VAINEYYIDAGGGSDSSGDGSSGNPWATLYYAFANSTHGTSGVIFWLHGTYSMTAALPTSSSASGNIAQSSPKRPIRIQGWDKLSTGERYPGIILRPDGVNIHRDSLMHGCSGELCVEMRNIELINVRAFFGYDSLIVDCYLHNDGITYSTGKIYPAGFYLSRGLVINCEVASAFQPSVCKYGLITGCLFTSPEYISSAAKYGCVWGTHCTITRNMFAVSGNYAAMSHPYRSILDHNSFLCTTGTAAYPAISIVHPPPYWVMPGNYVGMTITNNIVEGFGTQKAFELTDGSRPIVVAGNAAYNNGTDFDLTGTLNWTSSQPYTAPTVIPIELDNESLSGSPFAKSGALTFDNRFTYFAPNNVGNVLGGAYNGQGALDKGAVQTPSGYVSSSGSDMLTNPGMAGGMRG